MMRSVFLGMILFVGSISAAPAQAQNSTPWPNFKPRPRLGRAPGDSQSARLLRQQTARLPASATSEAIQIACPPEAVGATCGYVKVPLDREHPGQAKIRIYFELFPHSSSGPAESAILVNFGGPGIGTTGFRDFAQFVFASNFDAHDLLLVDDRGRGLSGTIDCPALQHGTTPFQQAEADCAAQLGNAASRYGTGDIAKDTEAVRAALGYDKVDYFGGSYGGSDVTAYATRFGEHLRSIVLDAPYGTPALDQFAFARYRTQSMARTLRLQCLRSPACSRDHADPEAELEGLIWAIRFHPVQGEAFDASGNLMHVRIDEDALLSSVLASPTGDFVNTGEILAAAGSLEGGDIVPLLRLGAEGFLVFAPGVDVGDPTGFTVGGHYATACVDANDLWDWSKPVSQRETQYAREVSALPSDEFEPFSRAAATSFGFSVFAKRCLWWQKPTPSSPTAPQDATYPRVPTLVLTGDLDTLVPIEETSKVAALFPKSTSVAVAEAGHETVFWTQCADNLISHFIETLKVGDTSCAKTPETVFPAVGRFPLLADDAHPAQVSPNGRNQTGAAERKVVTVAVAAATDALQRVTVGSGDGAGLRGGTFHTEFSDVALITLKDCAFARDVTVNGTVTWGADNSVVADLVVSGPGSAGGTLHVEGTWLVPGPVGKFAVSGVLGGREVAVLVPEA